ncbi:MAG: glutamate--tRNA ligase, partial [Nitrospinota bacterium]
MNISGKNVRVRFAPSPTGPLHAGNVRTAIFNWLFARHEGGKFILRIEDTDEARSEKKYADEITDSLKWLGIDWDEGPYYQSENRADYEKAVKKLLDGKKLYPCFCTEDELAAERKAAAKSGRPPVYRGRCKKLSDEDAKARMEKEPYALRFRIEGSHLSYTDAIRGETEVNLNLLGDFIVMRSGGQAVYNLAAAVDDAAMKITHVLRGEDHISNTPRQALLLEALGYEKPVYAHLPIILSKDDGTKLSKRHGGASFGDLIRGG